MSISSISSSVASQVLPQQQPVQQTPSATKGVGDEGTGSAADLLREGNGPAISQPVDPAKGRNLNVVA